MLRAFTLLLVGLLSAWSTPVHACAGDCGIDGTVSVDELILGVNIALGSARAGRCEAIDRDRDGSVTIAELVAAVNAALAGCPAPPPRLIVVARDGHIASLDLEPPWTVRATAALGMNIGSARCRAGRCLIVHPSDDAISIVAADDLARAEPIALERGAEPRDVALVDDDTALVGLYGRAELLRIDLRLRARSAIDLRPLADSDGTPETLRLAHCGHLVLAQLLRIDRRSGLPTAEGPGLAAIDLDRPAGDEILDADPATGGRQAIALAGPPNFDMPVDCATRRLWIAEPEPLMQGGGGYEVVDLEALVASDFPIATGAEVGGFEIVGPNAYWLITHTEFGPGPSSHLNFFGATMPPTYNTFAEEHVNDLAIDRQGNRLFFPDPCRPGPVNTGCDPGIHVFEADSGTPLGVRAIAVDFPPIEVAVSR